MGIITKIDFLEKKPPINYSQEKLITELWASCLAFVARMDHTINNSEA